MSIQEEVEFLAPFLEQAAAGGVLVVGQVKTALDKRLGLEVALASLPPYAPELNPIEHVWDELREKFFHNRVFKSLDVLDDHLVTALKTLEDDPSTVDSIVSRSWIIVIGAFLNSLMN